MRLPFAVTMLAVALLSAGPWTGRAAARELPENALVDAIKETEIYAQVKTLESADPREREAAVRKLGALGPDNLDYLLNVAFLVLAERVEAAGGPELAWKDPLWEQLLAETARAAAAMGPAVSERLAEHSTSGKLSLESEVAVRALLLLGTRARAANPVLQRGLDSEDFLTRQLAGKALAVTDAPAYAVLRAAARSPRADTRGAALVGLGMTRSAAVLEVVLSGLNDPETSVHHDAWNAIGELGAAAAPALPQLLTREDADVDSLAKLGDTAIPALVVALNDRRPEVADRAGETLALMGTAAIPALRAALDDSRLNVRVAAADAVGKAASVHKLEELLDLAPRLVELAGNADPGVRARAVLALGRLAYVSRSERMLEALQRALSDPDPAVARAALRALPGRELAATTLPHVERLLGSPSAEDRRAALEALSSLGPEARSVRRTVERLAKSDPDPEVRELAASLLLRMAAQPPLT